MSKRTTGVITLPNTMKILGGYRVMGIKTEKPMTILKNMIHELPFPDNVIDRVGQL